MSLFNVSDKILYKNRPAVVMDFKWNLVYIRFEDGEYEWEWVDRRHIKQRTSGHDTETPEA